MPEHQIDTTRYTTIDFFSSEDDQQPEAIGEGVKAEGLAWAKLFFCTTCGVPVLDVQAHQLWASKVRVESTPMTPSQIEREVGGPEIEQVIGSAAQWEHCRRWAGRRVAVSTSEGFGYRGDVKTADPGLHEGEIVYVITDDLGADRTLITSMDSRKIQML